MPGTHPAPVVLDTMGGDHAPDEIIAGGIAAVREHGARLVLVGHAPRIRRQLETQGMAGEIAVVHAEEELGMHEGALASWRKPRSSVAIACHLIKQGRASALVSAGSTAGVVATARLRLRGQNGVLKPAIVVTLPTRPTPTVFLDAGATSDVKPEVLAQFATLGTAYAQITLGMEQPLVGLLSIGSEPGKGDKTTRRAHELLSNQPGIVFAGNVEGDDLLRGKVNVVVTDGFTGNVALKAMEGAMKLALAELRATITDGRLAKMGAALQRRKLRELKERMDSDSYGGGVLLGLNGTVVIAHGASNARAISSACVLAGELAAGRIVERIREQMPPLRTGRFGRRPHHDKEPAAREREPAAGEPVREPASRDGDQPPAGADKAHRPAQPDPDVAGDPALGAVPGEFDTELEPPPNR